jgi:hypothetical protein
MPKSCTKWFLPFGNSKDTIANQWDPQQRISHLSQTGQVWQILKEILNSVYDSWKKEPKWVIEYERKYFYNWLGNGYFLFDFGPEKSHYTTFLTPDPSLGRDVRMSMRHGSGFPDRSSEVLSTNTGRYSEPWRLFIKITSSNSFPETQGIAHQDQGSTVCSWYWLVRVLPRSPPIQLGTHHVFMLIPNMTEVNQLRRNTSDSPKGRSYGLFHLEIRRAMIR